MNSTNRNKRTQSNPPSHLHTVMRKTQLFLFLFISVSISSAQTSDEIFQKIKKLNTLGSVLYIAAHPDDENTRLLTWLANERHLRTGYISLTRGDGGQNLIGKEQGDALGLIRTHELLAARSIDHAEQYFTRANDFGYSKTPEETFEIWNKESVLSDLVWVIRQFKPDILITRFPTTGEGGHGHHTASAILALEAFHAAADPERFPEQLKKVAVWQARRIFWNTFNFGSTNTTSPDQFKIDIGNFNPLLGKSYGEIAAESRSMHKSQGFGTAMQRGSNFEYFKLLDGDNIATDLFEGIDLSWKKISGGDAIQSAINRCILSFDHEHPAESLPQLTKIYNEIKLLPCKAPEEIYWKEEKVKETEELLLDCSGLWIEGIASDYSISPGQPLTMNCQIIARNDSDILLEKITFPGKEDTTIQMTLKQNELYSFKHTGVLPVDIHYSNPYWLDKPHGTGLFNIEKQELVGKPINDSQVNVLFHLNVSGAEVKVMRPVTFKYTDPAKGEIYRPLEILPPAVVNFPEKVFVFDNGNSKTISLFIKANKAGIKGKLHADVSGGWKIALENTDFQMAEKGEEVVIPITITPGTNTQEGHINVYLDIDGMLYNKSMSQIEYDHIPFQFILSDASAGLVNIDLKKIGTEIGYIPGAGDGVAECLRQIGYTVTELTEEKLSAEDLSAYSAIVAGIRAYNTNDRLSLHYKKLMEYINKGGNYIVQYNTNSRLGPMKSRIGPYPFTISRERVTDEQAKVRWNNGQHPILNFPNRITTADFEGWVQERGVYYASEIDPHYESILLMNDPGEKETNGSLIVSRYGKGNFVYTGLSFFRELPAGVPGAYRLFVNLLSIPKSE